MKTISVKEPVARALISYGAAVVGKNWPPVEVSAMSMEKYLQVTGIHISTQGSEREIGEIRDHVIRHQLGEESIRHPTPIGHVVASARMLGIVDSKLMTRASACDEIIRILAASKKKVSPEWAEAWMSLFPKSSRLWVFSDVQPCKPARWRGVMSMFSVPDEVFGRK